MSEYFRIPKLGQHYTLRWAAEDMEYERAKSNGNNDTENTDRNNTSAANEGTISKMLVSCTFYSSPVDQTLPSRISLTDLIQLYL